MEKPKLEEILASLLGCWPKLDADDERLALVLYRRLATGEPVSPEELERITSRSADDVRSVLGNWPGVYRDDRDRVVGFWGLALPAMKHRLHFSGRELHAWCAWDTLFLPEILGGPADVESVCPVSAAPIRLRVSPARIERASPTGIVMSFLTPEADRFRGNVITNFCHYIHFFRSGEEGSRWVTENPGTFLLSLGDAFELARLKNRAQFGEALAALREPAWDPR